MTIDTVAGGRLMAEWEMDAGAILVAWPHAATDWAPMLDEVDRCYQDLVGAIVKEHAVVVITPEPGRVKNLLAGLTGERQPLVVELPTDDTWTRDYGPLTVETPDGSRRLLDFQFNGWGLKFGAANDNLATSRLAASGFFRDPVENCRDFVLEGGSVETDGHGTLLTTTRCLMSANRNGRMSRGEIGAKLSAAFGTPHQLWLDHGALEGDDTDSHIDTLARLAPDDTIIYTGTSGQDDRQAEGLRRMAAQLRTFRTIGGLPFNLIELPLPDVITDEEGHRLPATYANYLVTSRAVFLPVYGQERNDALARGMLKVAFPNHNVHTVDCRALIKQHGSLHCATMQLYGNLPHII